jgi:1-acyl-sn-glycerol-3-phosphate acyltransferase
MTTAIIWWLAGGVFGAVIFWRYVLPAFRRARQYIRDVETCGYLPPPPTPGAVRFLVRASKVLAFIQVGKVKIEGIENLDGLDGPTIVTPNHPHWADTVVMPIAMNRPARYMAARGVFTFGGGLGALLFGPIGAFAADLEKGKGGPAREAAVKLTSEGQILVMFPEGWAYLDGITREFKKGAVRIARESAAKAGKTGYLVPVHLRYGKYPGGWILKVPPPAEYFLLFLLAPLYRRGVTVVIGKPIPTTDLPADDAAATEYLKQHVLALDHGPKKVRVSAS